jgi:hypothetical protein
VGHYNIWQMYCDDPVMVIFVWVRPWARALFSHISRGGGGFKIRLSFLNRNDRNGWKRIK